MTMMAKMAVFLPLCLTACSSVNTQSRVPALKSNSSLKKAPSIVRLSEKSKDENARSLKTQEEKTIDLRNRRLVLHRQNQNREEDYSKSLKTTAELMYHKGLARLEALDYGGALTQFTKVLKNDPRGKYSSHALFAKAMTYKKMNLRREAKSVLTEVLQRFPKTTESARAKAELSLMGEMLPL